MKKAQIILSIILTIVAVGGAFIAVSSGIDKHLEYECNTWIAQYEENVDNEFYYWTNWQVAQCEGVLGYTFDGEVK